MTHLVPTLACSLIFAVTLQAQDRPVLLLWAAGAPGALGARDQDKPTLTVYLPEKEKATGAAMVICPGGGYGGLAGHEGNDYALYLNQHCLTCFVLKYRLSSGGYRHPAMINDAQRAVRTVRARATEWGVDNKRVGVLCYAVITMGENTHGGSRKNLLGDAPAPELIELDSASEPLLVR